MEGETSVSDSSVDIRHGDLSAVGISAPTLSLLVGSGRNFLKSCYSAIPEPSGLKDKAVTGSFSIGAMDASPSFRNSEPE